MATKTLIGNKELDKLKAEADALKADLERRSKGIPDPKEKTEQFDNQLVSHVRTVWEKAKWEKNTYHDQMIANLRQKRGEYDPQKVIDILKLGSDIFMKNTNAKCRSGLDMLKEVYFQPGEKCFALEPSRIPELTPELEKQAGMTFLAEVTKFFQQMAVSGMQQQPDPTMMNAIMTEALPKFKKDFRILVQDLAIEKAKLMEDKIDDQFREGDFYDALADFLADLITLKAGFIKRDDYQKKIVPRIQQDPMSGKGKVVYEEKIIPHWYAPSPFDMFPFPGATDIQKGGLVELHRYYRTDIQGMIGLPGFDEEAIREILNQYSDKGLHEWSWDARDVERARAEGREVSQYYDWDTLDCIEVNDCVQGKILLDWAGKKKPEKSQQELFGKEIDPDFDYNVRIYCISRWILKVSINENPTGRKPYYKESYVSEKGTFWGDGVPETISDAQALGNSAVRALQNNIAIASGPQVALDVESLDPADKQHSGKMWAWKVWRFLKNTFSSKTEGFMQFFQPQMHAAELISVYDKAVKIMDEHSGIAGWTHGDPNVGGAGNTLGGLSMFMGQQNRGIRSVAMEIDRHVIVQAVTDQFYDNFELEEAEEYIGDMKIVAKGSSWLIARETQALRLGELIRDTNNPTDLGITGVEGRRYLLRERAKNIHVDANKAFPDEDRVKQFPSQTGGAVPGEKPPATDVAGNETRGGDFKQAQPGQLS